MARSLNAPLSPHEEVALRRVALGLAPNEVLSDRAVARLKSLALIEGSGAGLRLTQIGQQRYSALPGVSVAASAAAQKKLLEALAESVVGDTKH
ncbi:MAG: hypothetical protein LCH93_25400 [Proteobacteria bacterium]|nr:hypothetical protein [Pseudomonadota bacterium]